MTSDLRNKYSQREVDNLEHQESLEAKRVTYINGAGSTEDLSTKAKQDEIITALESLGATTGTEVSVHGSLSVATGVTVTLATYTVPASKKLFFRGVMVGGNEYGEFDIQIDASTQGLWRNSGSNPSNTIVFPQELEAATTQVIDIKVTNKSPNTKTFEATIFGSLRDA